MLKTISGRLVRPDGVGEEPYPGQGQVTFTPTAHGIYESPQGTALRGRESVTVRVRDGVMDAVHLVPGVYQVHVTTHPGGTWPTYRIELEEDTPEPIELADLSPAVVVDGVSYAKGNPGRGVQGIARDGDLIVFTYTDGTTTSIPAPSGGGGGTVQVTHEGDGVYQITEV